MNNNVVDINIRNFTNEVVNSNQKVLLDFYADWCGACQALRPVINSLSQETENVKYAFVNVENNPELAQAFSVMSIPALYVIENGAIVNRKVGAMNKPQLKQFLNIA